MLTPQDLIEIRKIAVAATLFTNADYIKATEEHAKKLEQLELAHRGNLARQVESTRLTTDNLRAAIHKEQEAWRITKAEQQASLVDLDKERKTFKEQCETKLNELAKLTQEVMDREAGVVRQEKDLKRRHEEMLQKEAQVRTTAETLNQERRAIQEKLLKLKNLAA